MSKKIPTFKNEDEERNFWSTHDVTEYTTRKERWKKVEFIDARPKKKMISIRIDPVIKNSIESVAKLKGIGYQTLISMWLKEKILEEKKNFRKLKV